MTTETPGGSYEDNYPQMPGPENWQSDTNFDLGWVASPHWVANKTLNQIYGDYDEFSLNPDDLLNFDHLDEDVFIDFSVGPTVYLAIWLAILVFFLIVGICWCAANKCCCCCRSSFKGRKDGYLDELENTDPNFHSERKNKSSGAVSRVSIVLSILMAVWLFGFLTVLIFAFASNEKTKDAMYQIQPDLDHAIDDIDGYIDVTRNQLNYSFVECYDTLETKLLGIVELCTGVGCSDSVRDRLRTNLRNAVARTRSENISRPYRELDDALLQVKQDIQTSKEDLDERFEDGISDANKEGIYWSFMLLNVLYGIIFGLALMGTVLAAFGSGVGKKIGFLLMRASITISFIVATFVVLQMATMFVMSGIVSEIICPAVRELEEEPEPTATAPITDSDLFGLKQDGDPWEVPNVGEILRACKRSESAYNAFNLQNVYNVEKITEIVDNFRLLNRVGRSFKGVGVKADQALTPVQTVEKIQKEVEMYAYFVRDSVKDKLGICEPVYIAINATVSLFCDKITAPIASYWFTLQFIPLAFILIFITALIFERLL